MTFERILTWQFWKNRWTQVRWGIGNYIAMAVSFVNLILLLRLNFGLTVGEDLVIAAGLIILASALGYLHFLKQQGTDALLANEAVINEIVRRIELLSKGGDKGWSSS